MVMDPAFLEGLPEGPDGDRTREFVAGACGTVCLDVTPGSGTIAGQVTRQDGEPVAAARLISAMAVSATPVTFGVTTGTLVVAGAATSSVAFMTDASGAFGLTVTATPPAVVLLSPDGGEAKLVEVT